jgi:hypothetical protein
MELSCSSVTYPTRYNASQTITMAAKNKARNASSKTTKGAGKAPAKLSTREEDLIWHMAHGYQLETSSLWDNPILRRTKDNTEVRATANRSTIEALHKEGLIVVAKEGSVLNPTVWHLTSKANALRLSEPHE